MERSRKCAPFAANIEPISMLTVAEMVLQSAVTLRPHAFDRPSLPMVTARAMALSPTQ